jgi:hypothetical protein
MKTEVHSVTLTKARDWAEKNLPYQRGEANTNRPLSMRKVNQYAFDMLSGKWRLTHQGIGFAKSGFMKDGQHRIMAIIQAGEQGATMGDEVLPPNPKISVQMQVTFGLEDDVFDVLDTGLPRSASQILAIAGYANQLHLAASARLLYQFDNLDYKYWRGTKISNHEILKTVQDSGIAEYLPYATPLAPVGFIPSALAAGYFICERALPTGPHEEFLDALRTGMSYKGEDDPRRILREYMVRSKGQPKVRREAAMHMALYIITWNDFAKKRKRNTISWRSTQAFPQPVEA